MKKIAIVQGHKKQCGVYQYGLASFRILEKSKKYKFILVPVSGPEEFLEWIKNNSPDAVIFNYDSSLLWWYNDQFASYIPCKKLMMVGHEPGFFPLFNSMSANFVISPNIELPTKKHYHIPRPIIELDHIKYSKPGEKIKIGNFGFGWYTKEYAKIIKRVNEQFSEDVVLNFNIGLGDYVDISGAAARKLADECRSLVNPNVELNISHEFLEMDDLISFLNGNDINIFYYGQSAENSLVLCSSSTDYALAAKKPIAINNSHMFTHIYRDSIDIDKTPIKKIIEQGLKPVSAFQKFCSEDNFRKVYEDILSKVLQGK